MTETAKPTCEYPMLNIRFGYYVPFAANLRKMSVEQPSVDNASMSNFDVNKDELYF